MKKIKLNPYLIAAIAIIVVIIIIRSKANAQDTSSISGGGGSAGYGGGSASNNSGVGSGSTGTPSSGENTYGLPRLGKDTVLSRGAYGYEVRLIQETYNTFYAPANNKSPLTLDGQFGPKTETAIEESTGKRSISYNDYFDRLTGFASGMNAIGDAFTNFASSPSQAGNQFEDSLDASSGADVWGIWDWFY